MKTVNLFEKGEEVLVKGKVIDVAMDNGEIVYQVITVDNGKNMGIWLTDQQLMLANPVSKVEPSLSSEDDDRK